MTGCLAVGDSDGPVDVDVIVVGAGGSGAPVAARVSDDPGCRVLVLEAGPVPRTAADFPPELLDAARLRGADPAHPATWDYPAHLTPSRPYALARGRILGGSTTINGAYFVRARRADHDSWVRAGLPEWSYEECLPFWRALESDEQYGDTAAHGATGPLPVTRLVTSDGAGAGDVTALFAEACRELGYAVEADKNGDEPAGWGPLPMNVKGGIRWNTGLAYLVPLFGTRPNLEVRGGVEVRRVMFDGTRAVGVEYVDTDGSVGVARADQIVLAAGAIASPVILLRSGVGPAAQLRPLGGGIRGGGIGGGDIRDGGIGGIGGIDIDIDIGPRVCRGHRTCAVCRPSGVLRHSARERSECRARRRRGRGAAAADAAARRAAHG